MKPLPRRAVILAAGRGNRLGHAFQGRPKGFLELAGSPLIVRSLRQLYTAGVQEIEIVTGYQADAYQRLAVQFGGLRLTYNPFFAQSDSMQSLMRSDFFREGDFLLLESDLVYENLALQALQACTHPNALLISALTNSADALFVRARGQLVLRLTKNRDQLEDVTGEMVGISRISAQLADAMRKAAKGRLAQEPNLTYEDILDQVAGSHAVYACMVEALIWSEIDTPEQLREVQEKILPRLIEEW